MVRGMSNNFLLICFHFTYIFSFRTGRSLATVKERVERSLEIFLQVGNVLRVCLPLNRVEVKFLISLKGNNYILQIHRTTSQC